MGDDVKSCAKCGEQKAIGDFARDRTRSDGLSGWCKACDNARRRKHYSANRERELAGKAVYYAENRELFAARYAVYYANNRDRNSARCAAWRAKNPDKRRANNQRRRAIKRAVTVEPFTSAELLEYYDTRGMYGCVYCGAPVPTHDDHIQPLALGGEHSRENLAPACATCNTSKGAKDPWIWIPRRLSELQKEREEYLND